MAAIESVCYVITAAIKGETENLYVDGCNLGE